LGALSREAKFKQDAKPRSIYSVRTEWADYLGRNMYVHTYMHSPHTTDRYWTSAKTLRRRLSSAPTICTPRSAVSILLAKKLSFLRVYADREPVSGLGFRV